MILIRCDSVILPVDEESKGRKHTCITIILLAGTPQTFSNIHFRGSLRQSGIWTPVSNGWFSQATHTAACMQIIHEIMLFVYAAKLRHLFWYLACRRVASKATKSFLIVQLTSPTSMTIEVVTPPPGPINIPACLHTTTNSTLLPTLDVRSLFDQYLCLVSVNRDKVHSYFSHWLYCNGVSAITGSALRHIHFMIGLIIRPRRWQNGLILLLSMKWHRRISDIIIIPQYCVFNWSSYILTIRHFSICVSYWVHIIYSQCKGGQTPACHD